MRRRSTHTQARAHRRPLAFQRPWQRPPPTSWLSIATITSMTLFLLLLLFARGPISRAASRFVHFIAPTPDDPTAAPPAPAPPSAPAPAPPSAPSPLPDDPPAPLPDDLPPP